MPANEFAMLQWAARAGIDVPEARLEPGEALKNLPQGAINPAEYALAVRRFDRVDGGRVHQEDFAQIREVATDAKYDKATYEGIGRAIAALCPPEDAVEYVRRLVAMVVMGNADAHLKNWTLRYPHGRQARLSPAYDLVCVTAYPETDHRLAFPLGGTTHSEAITAETFRALAPALKLSTPDVVRTIRETSSALAETWPEVLRDRAVPEFVADTVDRRLRALPLLGD